MGLEEAAAPMFNLGGAVLLLLLLPEAAGEDEGANGDGVIGGKCCWLPPKVASKDLLVVIIEIDVK